MKIRNGFVSNSSSSSFLIPDPNVIGTSPFSEKDYEEQRKKNEELAKYWELLDQMEVDEMFWSEFNENS